MSVIGNAITLGSGGGGGGGKTLLWNNTASLSTSVSSIILSDDYDKYAFLEFVFAYTNNTGVRTCLYAFKEALDDLIGTANYYSMREADCYWNFKVSNDKKTLTGSGIFYLSPKAVYGVKV